MVGFVTNDGAVRPLSEGFLPDCLEQRAIHDRGLLARQDLILVFDLAKVEVMAQHVVQRAAAERDTTTRRAGSEQLSSSADVAFPELPSSLTPPSSRYRR